MKRKSLVLILTLVIMVNIIAIPNQAIDIEFPSWEDKIDGSVYESKISENGKRLIHIFRKNISDDQISNEVYRKHGYSVETYETEELYNQIIRPSLTKQVEEKLGLSTAHSVSERMLSIGETLTPIEEALNEDYDRYILAKREVITDQYAKSVNDFIENNNINEEDIIYKGQYTSSIILYATDEEIQQYAKCSDVESIFAHKEGELKSSLNLIHNQVDTDSITGTKSNLFNSGTGYKGVGVKIGIIEPLRYNPENPHLSDIHGTQLQYIENVDEDGNLLCLGRLSSTEPDVNNEYQGLDYENHATQMTAIIVGQAVQDGGEIYEGVVPNATVYQTCAITISALYNAFSLLANLGVTVINCSFSSIDYDHYYSSIDLEIDKLIESTGVTCVVAAGNMNYDGNAYSTEVSVNSPALAYNAITVGNAYTKDFVIDSGTLIYSDYAFPSVHSGSCYQEATHLANKPDICAPGFSILYKDGILDSIEGHLSYGTSPAAAITTGIVAQIQEDMAVRLNPTRVKAHLLAGATDLYHIDGDIAETSNNYLFEKSGIGLVNAVNSIETLGMLNYSTTIFNTAAITETTKSMGRKNLTAGDTVRVVMTYNKPENSYIEAYYGNDVDLFIYNDSTDELIASSASYNNNVEVVQFTVPTTGYYHIEVRLANHIEAFTNTYLDVVAVWRMID